VNTEQVHTLPEAAELLGLSVKTLRKRAQQEATEATQQGRPAQAYLQDHKGGQRWVVTANLLESLKIQGGNRGTQQGSPEGSPMGSQRITELEAKVRELENALQLATLKADSHEAIATERAARLYELQQSVLALTGAVRALTEAKQEKRRWWKRSAKELNTAKGASAPE
jgi:Sec-independent protein translocase protein TatA